MRRTLLAATVLAPCLTLPAQANETAGYAAAEAAIAAFRDRTFLVTPCEKQFAAFWKAFRAEGQPELVYLETPFGSKRYFGYGNPAAMPQLADAQRACRHQAGEHGDMVLHVLRDRALEKERLVHQYEHAERVIGN